jgi:hypothetical protein
MGPPGKELPWATQILWEDLVPIQRNTVSTIYFISKIEITTLQKLTVQKLFQVYKLTYSTYTN